MSPLLQLGLDGFLLFEMLKRKYGIDRVQLLIHREVNEHLNGRVFSTGWKHVLDGVGRSVLDCWRTGRVS